MSAPCNLFAGSVLIPAVPLSPGKCDRLNAGASPAGYDSRSHSQRSCLLSKKEASMRVIPLREGRLMTEATTPAKSSPGLFKRNPPIAGEAEAIEAAKNGDPEAFSKL